MTQELERLKKNRERRQGREKASGKGKKANATIEDGDAASPSSTPAPAAEKSAGTTRKCANCGQIGHIKTNKKYCDTCLSLKLPERKARRLQFSSESNL
jgi:hypothetical protein